MLRRNLWKALGVAAAVSTAAIGARATGATGVRWSSVRWEGAAASGLLASGLRVELGLDSELQGSLKEVLLRARPIAGAATLVDVATGQVLAAAEVGASDGSLLFDPVAPAASVFKLVTTAALYERTEVTPKTTVCTHGGVKDIGHEHLRPAAGPGASCAPFGQALGVSRNAAYAQLATRALTRSDLVEMAERMGFNKALCLDSVGKMGALTVPYNDLAFARTATGFENSRLSVFGGAQLALMVASGGLLRPMHFAKAPLEPADEPRVMSERTAARLRAAMEITVHSGTARDGFVSEEGRSLLGPIQAAGKTGTLRPGSDEPTASWFIGFAPSHAPQVVVSVLLQNPERWHQKGHQVARDLLAAYFTARGVKGIKLAL